MTLLGLGVVQYRDAYATSGLLPQMLDALKWGTDWLVKEILKEAGDAAVLEPADARKAVLRAITELGASQARPKKRAGTSRKPAAAPRAKKAAVKKAPVKKPAAKKATGTTSK
jgi:hypothetical protein